MYFGEDVERQMMNVKLSEVLQPGAKPPDLWKSSGADAKTKFSIARTRYTSFRFTVHG